MNIQEYVKKIIQALVFLKETCSRRGPTKLRCSIEANLVQIFYFHFRSLKEFVMLIVSSSLPKRAFFVKNESWQPCRSLNLLLSTESVTEQIRNETKGKWINGFVAVPYSGQWKLDL